MTAGVKLRPLCFSVTLLMVTIAAASVTFSPVASCSVAALPLSNVAWWEREGGIEDAQEGGREWGRR